MNQIKIPNSTPIRRARMDKLFSCEQCDLILHFQFKFDISAGRMYGFVLACSGRNVGNDATQCSNGCS